VVHRRRYRGVGLGSPAQQLRRDEVVRTRARLSRQWRRCIGFNQCGIVSLPVIVCGTLQRDSSPGQAQCADKIAARRGLLA
jgi:hypothetical protein